MACKEHFTSRISQNMMCDILAGEQGPSCGSMEQIPDLQVVYIRCLPVKTSPRQNVPRSKRPQVKMNHVQTILTTPVDVLPIPDSTPVVFLRNPTIARSVLPFFAEVTLYSFLLFPDRLFASNTQRILDGHNLTEIAMRKL